MLFPQWVKHKMNEKTEQLIEEIADAAELLGQEEGLNIAKTIILDLAKTYFAENKDEFANILRLLSKRIENEAKKCRDIFEKTEMIKKDTAWFMLGKAIQNEIYEDENEKQ
jgi:transcription elongation factor GreA-like protein